jgi:hypothetical protein
LEFYQKYLPSTKSTVSEIDFINILSGLKFYNVDISKNDKLTIFTETFNYFEALFKFYKKNTQIRITLIQLFDNLYSQLDFELQADIELFTKPVILKLKKDKRII